MDIKRKWVKNWKADKVGKEENFDTLKWCRNKGKDKEDTVENICASLITFSNMKLIHVCIIFRWKKKHG